MPENGISDFPKSFDDSSAGVSVLTSANLRFEYNQADWVYEKLAEQITDFQEALDGEHEVGMMFASFGQTVMMLVEDVGFQNPNLLYFYGTVKGVKTQLIQHMSQLNFLLTSVARQPDKPARRIGFHVEEELQKDE